MTFGLWIAICAVIVIAVICVFVAAVGSESEERPR